MALLLALAAAVWLIALLVAPFLPTTLSAVAYGIGSFVCHQLPERSFHLAGVQLPVCARCTGIYAGAAIGAWVPSMLALRPSGAPPWTLAPRAVRWILGAAAAPVLLSVVVERAGISNVTNAARAMAGFPLGVGVAFVVAAALATLHYRECVPRRPTEPSPPSRI